MSQIAPPPSAGSNNRLAGLNSERKLKAPSTDRTRPTAPALSSSTSFAVCGWQRYMYPSSSSTPCSRANRCISWISSIPSAIGFSQSTCLPCFNAQRAHSAWKGWGGQT